MAIKWCPPVSADLVSSEESTGFKSIHPLLEEEEEEEEEPPRILLYHGKRVPHLREWWVRPHPARPSVKSSHCLALVVVRFCF